MQEDTTQAQHPLDHSITENKISQVWKWWSQDYAN